MLSATWNECLHVRERTRDRPPPALPLAEAPVDADAQTGAEQQAGMEQRLQAAIAAAMGGFAARLDALEAGGSSCRGGRRR